MNEFQKEIARRIIQQIDADAEEQFNVLWNQMATQGTADPAMRAIIRRAFVIGWQSALLSLMKEES